MELQESIVLAAIEEFKEKGLKFTMDDIAKRLIISKKTIYTVFTSKEELLDAIADYSNAQIKMKEQEILNSDRDIITKIHDIIIALPDNYKEIDFSKLDMLKAKYPKIYAKVTYNVENNWDNTLAIIKEGMKQGKIKKVNLIVLKEMISGSIEKFIGSTALYENKISYNKALEQMMDILMGGLIVSD